MLKKLYPPNIEGTIPAFYGTTLVVPFSMNKAVSKQDVHGMAIKIKAVQSGAYLAQKQVHEEYISFDPYCQAIFDLSEEIANKKLNIGQHYKIQIAYINKGDSEEDVGQMLGYFSTVAVVKYTAEPNVSIVGLETGQGNINMHQYQYIGSYYQSLDTSEKVYSYRFNLYDNDLNLIQTSGEKIHNSSLDIELYESHDNYDIEQDLEINRSYYLEYIVTTINNLKVSSGKYRIMQKKSINPEIKADLIPSLNFENGYVNIHLIGHTNKDGVEYAATGAFKILRASEEDNYATWNEVLKFALYGQQPSRWIWKDMTVKQGVTYRYALQQYNDKGLTSNRLESNPIYVDFEHAFLYDGTRQLKIKYNPKVTSFKNDILESKIDTIGGKFPFIFKNGNVKYKEFPISGLISCQLDEEFLFIKEDDFGRYDFSSNLTGENIASEREFKLEVLEWLNNGQPKLFRSPTEGNYIIRLLNVSMAPNDTVGRMLHTFSATAYEIADYTYKNLSELNLISVGDPTTKQLRWETVELDKAGIGQEGKNILRYKAVSLRFEGMIPGDKIYINDGITRIDDDGTNTLGFYVTIGVTGSYIINLESGIEVSAVWFAGSPADNKNTSSGLVQHQGTLTYAYYSKVQNRFDSISNIKISDEPLVQYIGEHDIINEIEDVKTEIQGFYWIHCMLRDIQNAYYNVVEIDGELYGKYFRTEQCYPNDIIDFDPYILYKITNMTSSGPHKEEYLLDGFNKVRYELEDYSSYVNFGNNMMDLIDTKEFTIKNPKDISTFTIGNGIMAEISYQKQIVDYAVENDRTNYPLLVQYKDATNQAYLILYDSIYNYRGNIEEQPMQIEQYRQLYHSAYNTFINELERVLEEKEAAQGDAV